MFQYNWIGRYARELDLLYMILVLMTMVKMLVRIWVGLSGADDHN